MNLAVFTGFRATGSIRASLTVADGERGLGSVVGGVRATHPLGAGRFHQILWYFVASASNTRTLQHLGSSQRRGSSTIISGQTIRILCRILAVHDVVLYPRGKPGAVAVSPSFLERVPRIRLVEVAAVTYIEAFATVNTCTRGEACARTPTIRETLTRRTALANQLPREIRRTWARLHLVAVTPVRRDYTLFRRQERARVQGFSVRMAQPAHVRAAVCSMITGTRAGY